MNDLLIALNQFHFLYPLWLLGLLLLPFVYWLAKNAAHSQTSWSQAINPQLLKYLLDDAQQSAKKWPLVVFISAIALTLIALAGPVWKKIPQPVHQTDDALVLVLDQSLSMLATDLKPSRQVTVKHKVIDLLKARKDGQTALVVYAGDAHIVSPLTDDTRTIEAMIPALSPVIMPALGSRVSRGIDTAKQALHDGGFNKGRILLITDGIQQQDIEAINEQLQASQFTLSILTVGTEDGGPIPIPEQGLLRDGGEIVIAKTDQSLLQQLAQTTGARIARLSIDESDINHLLPSHQFDLSKETREVEREMDQWQEQGPWLILLILPFAALAFRRGWFLSLFVVVLIQPTTAEANDWTKQLWQTQDQQAAKAFDGQDYQAAAELFSTPEWQGSAAYRAGDYEAAAKHFSQSDTASAHYNRGNALAQLGKLDESIKAYDEALKRDPNLEDAKANKQLIEELAKQQQNQQQFDSDQNQQSGQSDDSSSEQQQGQSDNQSSQEQNESSNQDQNQGQSQAQNQKEQEENQQQASQSQSSDSDQNDSEKQQSKPPEDKANENEADNQQVAENDGEQTEGKAAEQRHQQASQSSELSEEEQQAMEQWLRRIPDDPSALLKRKFNYQYQQNRRNNEFLPQQEDEAIW